MSFSHHYKDPYIGGCIREPWGWIQMRDYYGPLNACRKVGPSQPPGYTTISSSRWIDKNIWLCNLKASCQLSVSLILKTDKRVSVSSYLFTPGRQLYIKYIQMLSNIHTPQPLGIHMSRHTTQFLTTGSYLSYGDACTGVAWVCQLKTFLFICQ